MDWFGITANGLWILGLALLLSLLGFASWERSTNGGTLGSIFMSPPLNTTWNVAVAIFCLGMAATSSALWSRILWLILTIYSVFRTWSLSRASIK